MEGGREGRGKVRKGGKKEGELRGKGGGGERQCALVLSVLPHSLHVGIGHVIQCTYIYYAKPNTIWLLAISGK